MLQTTSLRSQSFKDFLYRTLDKCDNNLSMCIYNDEIDPGKEIAARHAKKLEAVYWSILDFGSPHLSHELNWFTLLVLRKDIREVTDGGMSHVLRVSLKCCFSTAGGCNLHAGVVFKVGDKSPRLIFGKIRLMNQDERAHKGITNNMGAGSNMLCPICINVHDHKMLDRSGRLLPSTCLDKGRFIQHTDETIRHLLRFLKDGALLTYGASLLASIVVRFI